MSHLIDGSSWTATAGGRIRGVRLSPSGLLVASWTQRNLFVDKKSAEGMTVRMDLDQVVWVGWNPQSHLKNHLTVLCSNGDLALIQVNEVDSKLSLKFQSELIVKSCEDNSLRPVSGSFVEDGLLVLLENGDVVKVGPWLPLPAILPKSSPTDGCTFTSISPTMNLVTAFEGCWKPKISPPLPINPEPVEVISANFTWIHSVTYRGLCILLMGWGPSRIDCFLVLEEELVLLESIDLPQCSPVASLDCRPATETSFLLTAEGRGVYYLELNWLDQLADSIAFDVSINVIRSRVTKISPDQSGLLVALPFISPATGDVFALLVGSKIERLNVSELLTYYNSLSSAPQHPLPFTSSALKNLAEASIPKGPEYSILDVSLQSRNLPKSVGSLTLPQLTEEAFLNVIDTVVEPLRCESISELAVAAQAASKLLKFTESAIQMQAKWLQDLQQHHSRHLQRMDQTEKTLKVAQDSQRRLEKRLFELSARVSSKPDIEMDATIMAKIDSLLDRVKILLPSPPPSISVSDPSILSPKRLENSTQQLQELCHRISDINI